MSEAQIVLPLVDTPARVVPHTLGTPRVLILGRATRGDARFTATPFPAERFEQLKSSCAGSLNSGLVSLSTFAILTLRRSRQSILVTDMRAPFRVEACRQNDCLIVMNARQRIDVHVLSLRVPAQLYSLMSRHRRMGRISSISQAMAALVVYGLDSLRDAGQALVVDLARDAPSR